MNSVILTKLIVAMILGAFLGLERELRQKPGGIKTNGLVSLASCAFVLIVEEVNPEEKARVITGIIQGVGFIGGGMILKGGNNAKGLTGAAEIWISAGFGLACAVGLWRLAITVLLLSLILLKTMKMFFRKFINH
ncbi:MgtC/SapB family protein [Cyanobacterium stanieri LEGE 03274]|uniref:MgtC/SapB family protein n=1 Tax=Cyanobacterium stanieri LEGE 03274 TaxID=1828756 RepID=A0ABR9V0U4_9CHRO|nr:MgtC/SapB family protein [Cyanobacterium stanieri]MBE9221500.1 MgtC/SapB family protein [Cyanobacterium stanieri LEGE 03274]